MESSPNKNNQWRGFRGKDCSTGSKTVMRFQIGREPTTPSPSQIQAIGIAIEWTGRRKGEEVTTGHRRLDAAFPIFFHNLLHFFHLLLGLLLLSLLFWSCSFPFFNQKRLGREATKRRGNRIMVSFLLVSNKSLLLF
jgi:hypothetical protein